MNQNIISLKELKQTKTIEDLIDFPILKINWSSLFKLVSFSLIYIFFGKDISKWSLDYELFNLFDSKYLFWLVIGGHSIPLLLEIVRVCYLFEVVRFSDPETFSSDEVESSFAKFQERVDSKLKYSEKDNLLILGNIEVPATRFNYYLIAQEVVKRKDE